MDAQQLLVDLTELKNISNGDTDFEKELITMFIGQIPVFISNMNSYLESGAMDELSREAHTAKSSVLIFGMKNTGKILKEIELLAKQNSKTGIEPLLKIAEQEMSDAESYLITLLSE